MRILHYALGFPPYRTGGLTRFCMDLMEQQICENDTVALLWPGEMLFSDNTRIKSNGRICGVESFEIINPLPIPYDEGIADISEFIKTGDFECYNRFIKNWKPDIIHIHTFMGVHKSFIDAAKCNKVKLVFTTHDFFGICPRVTLFRNGNICDSAYSCGDCPQCNSTALSVNKIKILQSQLYRGLKDSKVIKTLRKKHRDKFLSGETENTVKKTADIMCAKDYLKLRQHYMQMLEQMDVIHHNSVLTQSVYRDYTDKNKNVIIPITHSTITDNRRKKHYSGKLKIAYLGPNSVGKGFYLLKEALDDLWCSNKGFSLDIFFEPTHKSQYMNVHGRYEYQDLKEIFDNTDILVAPSLMYETFGYTVSEAISHGVPVITTDKVGAVDIIPAGGGIVLENMTAETLKNTIAQLDKQMLTDMNRAILAADKPMTISDMSAEIKHNCYL